MVDIIDENVWCISHMSGYTLREGEKWSCMIDVIN